MVESMFVTSKSAHLSMHTDIPARNLKVIVLAQCRVIMILQLP